MKQYIRKSALIFSLCAMHLLVNITTLYANGGSTDYYPGATGAAQTQATPPTPLYIYYDLRTSVRSKNTAPPTIEHDGRIYYKINQDMNEGAGGKWIYLYYARTDDRYYALCRLKVQYWNYVGLGGYFGNPNSELGYKTGLSFSNDGWTDLNQGAGGYYVKLVGYRVFSPPSFEDFFSDITALSAVSSRTSMTTYPNWNLIDDDLNRGAGGKYIYLIYK